MTARQMVGLVLLGVIAGAFHLGWMRLAVRVCLARLARRARRAENAAFTVRTTGTDADVLANNTIDDSVNNRGKLRREFEQVLRDAGVRE